MEKDDAPIHKLSTRKIEKIRNKIKKAKKKKL